MPKIKVIRAQIEGGKASPSPPLGPAIQQVGLDVAKVVEDINKATEQYKGLTVGVSIIVDLDTMSYEIDVKLPTTTSLLLNAVGSEEPSGDPANKKIGDLSLEKVIEIALIKKKDLTAKTLEKAVKTILGSAATIGLTVEGKDPKEVSKEIDSGAYKDIFDKYRDKWDSS